MPHESDFAIGCRFRHLNTNVVYTVIERKGDGRLVVEREDFPGVLGIKVWADYLGNRHNFEPLGRV